MIENKKVSCIILSGGKGTRLGYDCPKQFVKIYGVPMICHTVENLAKSAYIDEIYVVSEADTLQKCKELIENKKLHNELYNKVKAVIVGGESRQKSSFNGVKYVDENTNSEIVTIHDVARPFTSVETINANIEAALRKGCAVSCIPSKDTIRNEHETLKRDELFIVQTPQSFQIDVVKQAHIEAEKNGCSGTDDVSLAERIGIVPEITCGSYSNRKITTKEDLPVEYRVGKGYDVHRLVENRPCILGGVKIHNEMGLMGHSDADVLIHAVIDGILGAMGLGDIGMHFPDTDDRYFGISSLKLLSKVANMVKENGYRIMNIDSIVICEKPKVLPYVAEMKRNLSEILQIDIARINIKGTTTEKLGFTGRKEGIAAEAVCLLSI